MMYCPYCNLEYAEDEACFCFPRVEVFTPMFAAHADTMHVPVVHSKDPLPPRLAFLDSYRAAI